MYEVDEDSEQGLELHRQIQNDWKIFSFDDSVNLKLFLTTAVPDEPLLKDGVWVRLRLSGLGTDTDHLISWTRFSEEIRTSNRYFPQNVPDQNTLTDILLGSLERIEKDVTLYRARVVVPGEVLRPKDMGAPPCGKATAGRANPVGISHLYLSFMPETCIYETRVANHTHVAIGTFHATRDLSVLNLADVEAPDFFAIETDSEKAVETQVRRISFHRYLSALGAELTKPVRATDQPIDYIPTQYLCELAKSLKIDGVLYSSSLHPEGRNLVLFDVDSAVCDAAVELVEITSLSATWRSLT